MHNLGLGGLEFSPNHAIEQHHPDGYRTYEESLSDINELKETQSTHVIDFEPSTTTERSSMSSKRILEIKINDVEDSEEIVLVKETQQGSRSQEKITVRVKSDPGDDDDIDGDGTEKETFISMHDPKHRHPSYKGE